MQPLPCYLFAIGGILQQVRRTKHWTTSKVRGIYCDNPGVLTIMLSEVLGHGFRMSKVVVYADERGRNVGLLVQVGETEAG